MPIFYRGAGVGSYWHNNDARIGGFGAHKPGIGASSARLMEHVARGTTSSPYISLTRSYGVALDYALYFGPLRMATSGSPAYVYEIELNDPLPRGLVILDPIKEIATAVPSPLSPISYQHDGVPAFLLGVVSPSMMGHYLATNCPQPSGGGTPRPANLSIELEALVRTLRDAEILAVGTIPASQVVNRLSVY